MNDLPFHLGAERWSWTHTEGINAEGCPLHTKNRHWVSLGSDCPLHHNRLGQLYLHTMQLEWQLVQLSCYCPWEKVLSRILHGYFKWDNGIVHLSVGSEDKKALSREKSDICFYPNKCDPIPCCSSPWKNASTTTSVTYYSASFKMKPQEAKKEEDPSILCINFLSRTQAEWNRLTFRGLAPPTHT